MLDEFPGSTGDVAVTPERRPLPIASTAFGLAIVVLVFEGVAIYLASSGSAGAATTLGQILVVVTAIPLALGLIAAIRGPHREWGIAAMIVSVIANPLILLGVLSFFGSL
ncbi:hypothetical protein BKA04_001614 [Cryobacterium mesophilum]|uniref:hypothetical protein n=1 Tax=Terrimesophilobacter mesophilus TaxID=433647 RepID=UPI000CE446AE|nr:hypothetical protein [Terrimesophilobacter mesophilus]MBB5633391.1 hypothetical protein [Terrimesophilobacter mesophilus]